MVLFKNVIFRKVFIHTNDGKKPSIINILNQLCVDSMLVIKTYLPTNENFNSLVLEFEQNQPNLRDEELLFVIICMETIEKNLS